MGNRQRYLALKMPVAGDTETVTFVYVDPGRETDSELRSWGVAHGPLWVALRKKGRQVRVIGIAAENEALDRADRVLQVWAAPARWKPGEELTVKQEMKRIHDAIHHDDGDVLAEYGGFGGAVQRFGALHRLPEARVTEGATIDDHLTWRATRFAGSPKNLY